MADDSGSQTEAPESKGALDRVVGFLGWMVPGGLFFFVSLNFFLMFAGCMSGDFRNYTISGSPRLDSPSVPWYVHWSHTTFWYFLPFEGVLIALYVLAWVIRKQFADE